MSWLESRLNMLITRKGKSLYSGKYFNFESFNNYIEELAKEKGLAFAENPYFANSGDIMTLNGDSSCWYYSKDKNSAIRVTCFEKINQSSVTVYGGAFPFEEQIRAKLLEQAKIKKN